MNPPAHDAHALPHPQPAREGPPAPPQGEYEFKEHEEHVIRELAGAMRFVGIFLIVIGAVLGVIGAVDAIRQPAEGLTTVAQGTLAALLGAWTHSAGMSLWMVAETRGNDIANLMNALSKLARIFRFQRWMLTFVLAVVVVGAAATWLGRLR